MTVDSIRWLSDHWWAVPRRWSYSIAAVIVLLVLCRASSRPGDGSKSANRPTSVESGVEHRVQGTELRLWFSNEMVYGGVALPYGDTFGPIVGMEYGGDDSVEHLYGAGPWIGGMLGGEARVLKAYSDGSRDFQLDPASPWAARFYEGDFGWHESDDLRGCDDDGDGFVDEDPLDGADNDGDWVGAYDDVGADGLPDRDEYGCKGGFNATTNRDPAFDNYHPYGQDLCHPDALGNFPFQLDPYRYTEGNRMPDGGEPHVDEDYGLVSTWDKVNRTPSRRRFPEGSVPFDVDLIQRNYSFAGVWAGSVAPIEFTFVNRGDSAARDVYLGFFADMDVGHISRGSYYARNYSCYIESLRTAYTHNPTDPAGTPAGVTVLDASGTIDSMIVSFYRLGPPIGPGGGDDLSYRLLSGTDIPPSASECQSALELLDTRFLLSVGPYPEFKPGDTLRLTVAFVGGDRIYGKNSLAENAARAIVLYERDYFPPVTPSSPFLTVEQGDRSIHVRWDVRNGIEGPVVPWDLHNTTVRNLPDDHWRRTDPPCDEIEAGMPCPGSSPCAGDGDIPGGRNFEGFRLYRSDASDPVNEFYPEYTLVREYDLDDEFGHNFGIDSEYTDVNLRPGMRYWYGVTSFGIPEVVVRSRRLRSGAFILDTISVQGLETPTGAADQVRFDLKYSASDEPEMVKVVPNPYRADADYTREGGGWEGDVRNWSEYNRVLKFIHLPRSCTIRICTLAGDIVSTLRYEAPPTNPNQGELDWNLISEGGWSVASGVYVFIVESDLGTQVGKFVVIR